MKRYSDNIHALALNVNGTPIMSLGQRVRDLVDKRFGGNLSRAAKAADLPYATFYEVAQDKTANPSADTLHRIATALGVTVPDLLGTNNPNGPPSESETGSDRIWLYMNEGESFVGAGEVSGDLRMALQGVSDALRQAARDKSVSREDYAMLADWAARHLRSLARQSDKILAKGRQALDELQSVQEARKAARGDKPDSKEQNGENPGK